MNSLENRVSRISALRPAGRRGTVSLPGDTSRSNFESLVRLLKGTIQKNDLGRHTVVRRVFDEPCAGKVGLRALKLLLPDMPESVCDPGQWLFLDTETTGLAGGTGTYAFLVGIGWWEAGRFIVILSLLRTTARVLTGRCFKPATG
jgi:uncharacterized protein YprB with RNaseH-like and TPR domain